MARREYCHDRRNHFQHQQMLFDQRNDPIDAADAVDNVRVRREAGLVSMATSKPWGGALAGERSLEWFLDRWAVIRGGVDDPDPIEGSFTAATMLPLLNVVPTLQSASTEVFFTELRLRLNEQVEQRGAKLWLLDVDADLDAENEHNHEADHENACADHERLEGATRVPSVEEHSADSGEHDVAEADSHRQPRRHVNQVEDWAEPKVGADYPSRDTHEDEAHDRDGNEVRGVDNDDQPVLVILARFSPQS